jgi:farnesyl-diphosphate farnesyltransferase
MPAGGATAAEAELAARLPGVIARLRRLDPEVQGLVAAFLQEVTGAMTWDLEHFPREDAGRLAALAEQEELEEYCRLAGGTAGRLWTRLLARGRLPGWERMEARGVAYGKGLQLINILRDLPRDLRIGRCYLPRADLESLGLAPADLLEPGRAPRLRPLFGRLVGRSRELLGEGRHYLLALPRRAPRLRLATALPLAIGLETLEALDREKAILDPERRVKIDRRAVRRLVAGLLVRLGSNRALDRFLGRRSGAP